MQEPPTPVSTPKPPKKKAAIRRTQPQQWFAPQSEPLPSIHEDIHEVVSSLIKRVNSLEEEWQEVLEHLSQPEGSMESQEEDAWN